jgi:hypothetical protein
MRPANVVWRETWRGRVWRAIACRLVEERDDGLLVLWHPDGTPAEIPVDDIGRRLRIPDDTEWRLQRELGVGQSLGVIRLGSREGALRSTLADRLGGLTSGSRLGSAGAPGGLGSGLR